MKAKANTPSTVDKYIADFPPDVQTTLQKIRAVIRKAAPKAQEKISYGIPCFALNGTYLLYFAAHKSHFAVYPAPRGSEEFKDELAAYKGGKGTIQFPADEPVPFGLIGRIVKFRAKESAAKLAAKAKPKPAAKKKAAAKKR